MADLSRVDPAEIVIGRLGHSEVIVSNQTKIEIVDLVDGKHPELLDALLDLHTEYFPEYEHIRTQIARDSKLSQHRGDLVVHQFLLLNCDVPCGFLLVDSNLKRGLSCVLFVALNEDARHLDVEGRPLMAWLLGFALAQLTNDCADDVRRISLLGLVGEATSPRDEKLWKRYGLRPLEANYFEPTFDGFSRSRLDLKVPATLMWLPPYNYSLEEIATQAGFVSECASTAFFVDYYGLSEQDLAVTNSIGRQIKDFGHLSLPRQI
jgi:hypothetical protein